MQAIELFAKVSIPTRTATLVSMVEPLLNMELKNMNITKSVRRWGVRSLLL